MQLPKITRIIRYLALVGLGGGAGCKGRETPAPVEEPVVVVQAAPCEAGRSDDPPRGRLLEAHRLLRTEQYAQARSVLDGLLEEKPNSVTALALRGDATLFDETLGAKDAALRARADYERASQLMGEGCGVERRTEYYLRMGEALASLRLAATEPTGRYDADELDRAEAILQRVEKRWPESAEVHYHRARIACARGTELDDCVTRFARTIEVAESLSRPRFLRAHRSREDWVVRSESQSEFGALRSDPRYRKLVQSTRDQLGK